MSLISKKEYARRRKHVMEMMGKGSIAIIPTSPIRIRNRDVEYSFRPDSDFYYLTGFAEPDAVAVLIPGRKHAEYILFCNERDPEMEIWNGPRAGQDGAVSDFQADDSFPITDIDDILPGLLENNDRVYYNMGCHPDFDQRVIGWINSIRNKSRSGVHTPGEVISLENILHEMRLFKSAAEIRVMRKAAKISVKGHQRAMQLCKPNMMEYQIEAELLSTFMHHGSRSPAYSSIVGGGANGCVLHYVMNNEKLFDGELLLIDAGAELDHYASDITRTFPVNGKFSPAQRAIYDVVLAAQQAAIEQVKPGNHWNDPHEAAVKEIVRGLIDVGILKGTLRTNLKNEAYKRFYMHRTGHWLGMDVHDVGEYKVGDEWRVLEPGMVMTVEPGIYIPEKSKGIAKKWWNIGIRIEDDVLVTRDGYDVLTRDLVSDADDIEALMAAK